MRLPRRRWMLKAKHLFRCLVLVFIRAESGTFNCSIEWSGMFHLRYKAGPRFLKVMKRDLSTTKIAIIFGLQSMWGDFYIRNS